MEAGTKTDPFSVSSPSEGIDLPPIDISDDKRYPLAYSIQNSKMGHRNELHDVRPREAVHVKSTDNQYKIMSDFLTKIEYASDVPVVTVNESVNKVFTDKVDYKNYRLSKKSARYYDDVSNEINKMTEKTAVQIKYLALHGKDPCR